MNQQTHPTVSEIENALGLSKNRKRKNVLQKLFMAGVALVVLAGGYYVYAGRQTAAATVVYETTPATRANVVVTVAATGSIEPLTQVDIGSEASGVVRDVLVKENATVKTGDVLATLDTSRLEGQRARALAQVQAAKARLSEVEATVAQTLQTENRQKALRQKGLSTGQDMDTALAASKRADASLAAATADVAAAQADLDIVTTDLRKTNVLSPIDGMVLKRSVEPGQTVAASLQAPVLFQIAQDLSRIQLEAAVDEADIGVVKVGQRATFTVDAYRGRSFPAKIERISFAPETVDGVVTYKAVLSAANEDLALRPGMTATARIVVEDFQQALTVTNEALRYQPPQRQDAEAFSITRMFMPRMPRSNRGKREVATDGKRPLYVLKSGQPLELRVKTGATDGKVTIIESDELKPDDLVVTAQKAAGK
jgi:HlyD family secretion protein